MNHYFKSNENLKHSKTETEYIYKSERFNFVTDAGVFSKTGVDYATDILLGQLPELSGEVLDLGCGFGCVGVVLAKIYGGKISVTMSDINARAVGLAAENAEKNGVRAAAVISDGFAHIPESFDAIILNPPIHAGKQAVYKIYLEARAHLKQGGRFFIVIQKKHGAASHRQKLGEIFGPGNVTVLYSKKGVFIFDLLKN